MNTTVWITDLYNFPGLYENCEYYQALIIQNKTNFLMFNDCDPYKNLIQHKNTIKEFKEWLLTHLDEYTTNIIIDSILHFEITIKQIESIISAALTYGLDVYKGKRIVEKLVNDLNNTRFN